MQFLVKHFLLNIFLLLCASFFIMCCRHPHNIDLEPQADDCSADHYCPSPFSCVLYYDESGSEYEECWIVCEDDCDCPEVMFCTVYEDGPGNFGEYKVCDWDPSN